MMSVMHFFRSVSDCPTSTRCAAHATAVTAQLMPRPDVTHLDPRCARSSGLVFLLRCGPTTLAQIYQNSFFECKAFHKMPEVDTCEPYGPQSYYTHPPASKDSSITSPAPASEFADIVSPARMSMSWAVKWPGSSTRRFLRGLPASQRVLRFCGSLCSSTSIDLFLTFIDNRACAPCTIWPCTIWPCIA